MSAAVKRALSAFAAGLLFAVGLAVAGMTLPSKVVGFLDLFGAWDPSLALVMVGAIGVHAILQRLVLRREAPLFEPRFLVPTRRDLDARLLGGAALFGVGWGLGGYCPGPGITSLPSGLMGAVVFVLAMAAGMWGVARFESIRRASSTAQATSP